MAGTQETVERSNSLDAAGAEKKDNEINEQEQKQETSKNNPSDSNAEDVNTQDSINQQDTSNVKGNASKNSKTTGSSNATDTKPTRKRRLDFGNKNLLTKLVPGYVAPMKLTSSSLERIRPQGGLEGMCRAATRQEAQEACQQAKIMAQRSGGGSMSEAYQATHASVKITKKQRQKARLHAASTTAGDGWFGMRPSVMTEEVKQDMALIKNRNYLDPKRFYKSSDMGGKHGGKHVQVGTVVEGASEFYSSRLTKKQRRGNLVEEIMADPDSSNYAKKKFKKMQQEKEQQHRKWKKRNPNARAKEFRKLK